MADEWAAVLNHQAAVDKQIQEEEKRFNKERQKRYREELDRQYLEATKQHAVRRGSKDGGGAFLGLDKETLEKLRFDRRKTTNEVLNKDRLEREQAQLKVREQQLNDKKDYQQYLTRLEEAEREQKRADKERKRQFASAAQISYLEQQQDKLQKCRAEKERDKEILVQAERSWPLAQLDKERVKLSPAVVREPAREGRNSRTPQTGGLSKFGPRPSVESPTTQGSHP